MEDDPGPGRVMSKSMRGKVAAANSMGQRSLELLLADSMLTDSDKLATLHGVAYATLHAVQRL